MMHPHRDSFRQRQMPIERIGYDSRRLLAIQRQNEMCATYECFHDMRAQQRGSVNLILQGKNGMALFNRTRLTETSSFRDILAKVIELGVNEPKD